MERTKEQIETELVDYHLWHKEYFSIERGSTSGYK